MSVIRADGFTGLDERVTLQNGISAGAAMRNFRLTAESALEKRPARTLLHTDAHNIDGIWKGVIGGGEKTLFAAGGTLYSFEREGPVITVIGSIGSGSCDFFTFGGALYILNGSKYSKYDGTSVDEVEGYIPCVAVSCSPNGEGTPYEPLNLLNDGRRQLFNGNGSDKVFKLAEEDLDDVLYITVDGEEEEHYSADLTAGTVTFTSAPASGLDNVEICYTKTGNGRTRITKCTKAMQFGGNSDGRIFLWGNPDSPDCRFYSDIAAGVPSAEYFPVNNFTVIGDSAITCIVQQYDRQLIFTKNRAYYSYCELKDDGNGNVRSSFPVFSLNGEKGCLITASGCVIDNKPVTLCGDGINVWESTGVENEKNAVCISGALCETMRYAADSLYSGTAPQMFDFQCRRELYFILGATAYVYKYDTGRWYALDGFSCDGFFVYGSEIYFYKGKKLYVYSDAEGFADSGFSCEWQSVCSVFGHGSGKYDAVNCEADVYITGPAKIKLETVQENGSGGSAREYDFAFGTEGHRRISVRPHIKRALPAYVKITTSGAGSIKIYGITITTRKRERSDRNGI
ncbi:MAG: hypothetical protein IK047_06675 [Clostridia bacterium]|nr:hypothetical protein [Clostridia bacterium]